MKHIITPALLATVLATAGQSAQATELSAYCALLQGQAAVRTELLSSSVAFSNLAPDQTGKEALTVGVRKSLSSIGQAKLVSAIAAADCEAYTAQSRVTNALTYVETQVEARVLMLKVDKLKFALDAADAHVVAEQAQFQAQAATWTDLRSAFDIRDRLKQLRWQALQDLARLSTLTAFDDGALQSSVSQSTQAQADAMRLRSQLDASAGKDFSVALGVQRGLSTGRQTPYVGITYSWNFGSGASELAAKATAALTTKYLDEAPTAARAQLSVKRSQLESTRLGLVQLCESLRERLQVLNSARAQTALVPSAQAQRATRGFDVEVLTVEADLAAAQLREQLLAEWLAKQQESAHLN